MLGICLSEIETLSSKRDSTFEEGTVNERVDRRRRELVQPLVSFDKNEEKRTTNDDQDKTHHIPLLTVVTDLAPVHRLWFHKAADLCLVSTPAAGDQAIECGLLPDKVQVTGIPVHPNLARQDRPRAAIQAELGWPPRPDLTTVLAVGSKRVGHLADVVWALNHTEVTTSPA
jgi:hypothetical protein